MHLLKRARNLLALGVVMTFGVGCGDILTVEAWLEVDTPQSVFVLDVSALDNQPPGTYVLEAPVHGFLGQTAVIDAAAILRGEGIVANVTVDEFKMATESVDFFGQDSGLFCITVDPAGINGGIMAIDLFGPDEIMLRLDLLNYSELVDAVIPLTEVVEAETEVDPFGLIAGDASSLHLDTGIESTVPDTVPLFAGLPFTFSLVMDGRNDRPAEDAEVAACGDFYGSL